MSDLATNVLYYGDNLDILRKYIPDASVDLIYLDPPFNSNRDYNVIFRDESGNRSDAQHSPSRTPGTGVHRPSRPTDT
jgi:site-specific DNA-methyltransferase (adenine-specific)